MRIFTFLLLAIVAEASYAQLLPFYVGTWRSNEALTLASMEKDTSIPADTRKMFRENFYGKLVNVIREDSFTTYFADQKPDVLNFIQADIQVTDKDTIVIRYFHEGRDQMVERELKFENNCYTVPVLQWHFDEYFCKVLQ